MKIIAPPSLHYPITIVDLAKKLQDEVQRTSPLFNYTYDTVVIERDRYGEEKRVTKSFPARFDSPTDGIVTGWFIKKGTVIREPK
jgi:RNA polymerase II subunit A C-terminal domain phosphatase